METNILIDSVAGCSPSVTFISQNAIIPVEYGKEFKRYCKFYNVKNATADEEKAFVIWKNLGMKI